MRDATTPRPITPAESALVQAIAARLIDDHLREITPPDQGDTADRPNHAPLHPQRKAA